MADGSSLVSDPGPPRCIASGVRRLESALPISGASRGVAPLSSNSRLTLPPSSMVFHRLDVLHRAEPAARGDVEDDSGGIAVLHLVVAVRRVGRASLKVHRAGLLRLLFRLLEVVDPHAEVHDPVVRLVARDAIDLAAL